LSSALPYLASELSFPEREDSRRRMNDEGGMMSHEQEQEITKETEKKTE
jgi:hypothetical protein